jgi:hypothetical protein
MWTKAAERAEGREQTKRTEQRSESRKRGRTYY